MWVAGPGHVIKRGGKEDELPPETHKQVGCRHFQTEKSRTIYHAWKNGEGIGGDIRRTDYITRLI
ncbi:hypothetical protein J2TS6_03670 [Paenibacillus albilobatus]|uniref:Uncharacterized protein n=1 Tax=Paenibacillus albilobatus TaxID=2716884 RepID=A0A919XAT7_9BACL|nr:hypothetical protein J2TS6_03670 [Paenibacillus albilobatus]